MIAPFWDDLRTDVSGGIVSTPGVYVDYVANCLIITWEATRAGASADSIQFQVVLAPNGIVRVSINSATNFANFSPTLGISKATTIDFINMGASTQKTWDFLYNMDDLFYYDRGSVIIAGIDVYPPTYQCLTSNGYVNYGECHAGPTASRDFVPDFFQWAWEVNNDWFGTNFKWTENLYANAQSWSGKDFCYTLEYNIPRVSGTVTSWYSTLPNVEWNSVTAESWGGVDTWELDAHTFNPEDIQVNTMYSASIWMTMESGYSIVNVIGQESELYDDGFPWRNPFSVNGAQRDWFKQFLGTFWVNSGVVRFGCGPPKVLLEQVTFSGGSVSVTSPENSTLTQIITLPSMYTNEDIDAFNAYITSRINATNELIAHTKSSQSILATVTFTSPISPNEYIDWVKKLGIEINSYSLLGSEGYGGSMVPSKETPYDEKFESDLNKLGFDVVGITGFTGSIPANKTIYLQNNAKVLLVDPWEDLNVQQLKQKYVKEGYSVTVIPSIDLWPRYNALKTS
jgi:hypothetical protein